MHPLRPLALWISLLSPSLWAATPLPNPALSHQMLTSHFSVLMDKSHLKVPHPPSHALLLVGQHQDAHHHFHIRLQQYYQAIPIIGGYAIIHSAQDLAALQNHPETPFHLTGQLFEHIEHDLQSPPQGYTQSDAALKQYITKNFPATQIHSSSIQKYIYVDQNHTAHWAYQIKVKILAKNHQYQEPSCIIDAESHQIYEKWDELQTELPAHPSEVEGRGYGGNAKTGPYQFGRDKPYLHIQNHEETSECRMENKRVLVTDVKHRPISVFPQAMKFPCSRGDDGSFLTGYQQDGYDAINGAYSPSNDALYIGQIIHDFYHQWYHVDPLSSSAKTGTEEVQPSKLLMNVHVGKNYANAFWDGKSMNFGDGDENDFYPLVSIGVGAHEISHGFTQHHSHLRYYGESGALNEAFSDMAAKTAEAFAHLPLDWRIGAEILKPSSTMHALRYMDQPHLDGDSVETLEDYHKANARSWDTHGEGLDVHFGSGVFNRVFYLIASNKDWNIRQTFDVMLHANMNYWTPYSKFQDAGCGILAAAKDQHYPLEAIVHALSTVGLNPHECDLN